MIRPWPENTAEIYREIEEEERRLANAIWPAVVATWPSDLPDFQEKETEVKAISCKRTDDK